PQAEDQVRDERPPKVVSRDLSRSLRVEPGLRSRRLDALVADVVTVQGSPGGCGEHEPIRPDEAIPELLPPVFPEPLLHSLYERNRPRPRLRLGPLEPPVVRKLVPNVDQAILEVHVLPAKPKSLTDPHPRPNEGGHDRLVPGRCRLAESADLHVTQA